MQYCYHVLTDKAAYEFQISSTVTDPLAAIVMMQGNTLPDLEVVKQIHAEKHNTRTPS